MGDEVPIERLWPWLRGYLKTYAVWTVLSALGLWCLFRVRGVLAVAIGLAGLGRWLPTTLMAIVRLLTIVLSLIWLAGVVMMEAYLRKGAEEGLLWRRVARIAVPELAVLGVAFAVEFLFAGQVGFP